MNSSILSSNHLSFNSSISQEKHECSHLELYKKTYQQLSALRIDLRATQQQTQVMRNTVRGLEEENKYLKAFLGNKKEMITKLNYQIACCNQEINRLEEELSREKELKNQFEEKYNESVTKNKQMEKIVCKQKQAARSFQDKVRKIEGEMKNREVNVQASQELKQENEALKQVCRLMQANLQSFKKDKGEIVLQVQNFSRKSEIVNETMRQFNHKWIELIQTNKLEVLQLQMAGQTHKNECNLLKVNLQKLQLELAQQKKNVQLQKEKLATLKSEMQKKQVQNEEMSSRYNMINKNKEEMMKKLVYQLVEAMKKYLGQQNQVLLHKILNMVEKTDPQTFEMDVLINQLWNMTNLKFALSMKHELESKKVQKVNQELLQLQQQLELLSLNHRTLERQYAELLQDNRRLIKYNTISQFRMRRNVVPDKNQQKEGLAQLQPDRKEENGLTFRTQRKDSFKQAKYTRTRSTFGSNKENDYSAYNHS